MGIILTMSKTMWILLALLSVLVISSMYREYTKMPLPEHLNCKESMLEQMFSNKCTPRNFLQKSN